MLLVLLFVYFAYIKFCPFSLGARVWLRLVLVALSALFYQRFCLEKLMERKNDMSRHMTKPTMWLWPSEDSDQPGRTVILLFCHEAAHITVYYSELVVNPAFQYSGDISKGASPDGKVDDRKKNQTSLEQLKLNVLLKKEMIFHQMLLAT